MAKISQFKQAMMKLYILHHAPYFKNYAALTRALGLRRARIYDYQASDPDFTENLDNLLGSAVGQDFVIMTAEQFIQYCEKRPELHYALQEEAVDFKHAMKTDPKRRAKVKKQTVSKRISIAVPRNKRDVPRNILDYNSKKELLKSIIRLFKAGISIKESCAQVGVGYDTFNKWTNPTNYTIETAEFITMWAQAKIDVIHAYDNDFLIKARTVLNTHLEDKEIKETVKIGKIRDGKLVVEAARETTKVREASLNAAIFALKTLDSKYSDRVIDGSSGDQAIRYMSDAELDKKIAEARQALHE